MRGPFSSNGLELIYIGDSDADLNADTVQELALKFNSNSVVIDITIGDVKQLNVDMATLKSKGHVVGLLNGGVSGAS